MAVLKEFWTPDTVILPGLAKSTIDYLDKLKVDLELAAQYASEHAEVAQKRYTDYYNLRAREKSFTDGEKVVVLAPGSSNKLYSR